MRRWLMVAVVLTGPLHAATFKLCSQNTLHLGYSSSNSNKVKQLKTEFATCDITLLQEVMRKSLDPPPPPAPPPSPPVPPLPNGALRAVTPAPGSSFTWNVPFTEIIGKTSYKESYAFIVKSTFTISTGSGGGFSIYFPSATLANKFARKPASILIQAGTTWMWLTDYHAIFGKRQSDRETEVREMAKVADELKNTSVGGVKYDKIIIGGDWNLDANNSAYAPLKKSFSVAPNKDSSLTTKGDPSEPYDHFAWTNNLTVTNADIITPADMKDWRKNVSDHMGIKCTVTY